MRPQGERDAGEMVATMDHSDIRGLATAFHLIFAWLPRSKNGDHPKNRVGSILGSHKTIEDSPHRSHAGRRTTSLNSTYSLIPTPGSGHDV
jgi:hypothetical protein